MVVGQGSGYPFWQVCTVDSRSIAHCPGTADIYNGTCSPGTTDKSNL